MTSEPVVHPGLKQSDLKPCLGCGHGVMHDQTPIFYRVTLETHCADLGAMQRQHGMEMMMGKAAPLASILGPNEDMTKRVGAVTEGLLCGKCALSMPALVLLENAENRDDG